MNDVIVHKSQPLDIFGHDFEAGMRIAKAMTNSLTWTAKFAWDSAKKQEYPKEVQISTAMTILDISYRLGISWSEVMQNGAIANGKWTWASEYIVAHVMNSPKYKDFEYVEEVKGKCKTPDGKEIDNYTCHLVGIRHDGKRDVGSEVSFEMAIADGWWARPHSKWPRMPKKMLRARAISFFNREWPTATLLGFKSQDEQDDSTEIQDAVVIDTAPTRKPRPAPKATHVVTITDQVVTQTNEVFNMDAEVFKDAKAEQITLANGDAEWTAAIEGCTTIEELEEVREQFDL